MTEYELLELTAGTIDSMSDSFTIFLSIASGYLVVAYLVGAKLTRAQTAIISSLFIVGSCLQSWALVQYQIANQEYLAAKALISPLTEYQMTIASNGGGHIIAALMFCGMLASLYFMWSVRHPASTER